MQNCKSYCNDTYNNVSCVKHLFMNSVIERLRAAFSDEMKESCRVSSFSTCRVTKCKVYYVQIRTHFSTDTGHDAKLHEDSFLQKDDNTMMLCTLQFGKLLMKNNFVFQLNLMLVTRQLEDNGENINDDDEDIISRLPDCCWAGSSLAQQAVVWGPWQW